MTHIIKLIKYAHINTLEKLIIIKYIFIAPYSHCVLYGALHHLFLELLKYSHLDKIRYNFTYKNIKCILDIKYHKNNYTNKLQVKILNNLTANNALMMHSRR